MRKITAERAARNERWQFGQEPGIEGGCWEENAMTKPNEVPGYWQTKPNERQLQEAREWWTQLPDEVKGRYSIWGILALYGDYVLQLTDPGSELSARRWKESHGGIERASSNADREAAVSEGTVGDDESGHR